MSPDCRQPVGQDATRGTRADDQIIKLIECRASWPRICRSLPMVTRLHGDIAAFRLGDEIGARRGRGDGREGDDVTIGEILADEVERPMAVGVSRVNRASSRTYSLCRAGSSSLAST